MIASPRDGNELRRALATAVAHTAGPFAIRFPRSTTPKLTVSGPVRKMKLGAWDVRTRGKDVLLLGLGKLAVTCEEATRLLKQDGISVTLADPRWVKPLTAPGRRGRRPPAGRHRGGQRARRRVRLGRGRGPGRRGGGHPALRLGIPDQFAPTASARSSWPSWAWTPCIANGSAKALHRLEP